jgi:hypothetical protein
MIKIFDENNVEVELWDLIKSITVEDMVYLASRLKEKSPIRKFIEKICED